MAYQAATFSSRPSKVLAVGLAAIAVVSVTGFIINRGPVGFAAIAPGLILLAVAYFVFWRPKLTVNDDTVIVVNPFTTHVIPIRDITAVSIQWNLRLEVQGTSLGVWAVPRSSNAPQVVSARRDAWGRPDYDAQKQYQAGTSLSMADAAARVIMSRLSDSGA